MIAIIDYGMGNLRSVGKALEKAGAEVLVTNNAKEISNSKAVVLPGVGAFYHGMENIKQLGFLSVIKDTISEGKPFLGICLGLQLLFGETEEHGIHKGLDIIKGRVRRFVAGVKIPHMGWNECRISYPVSRISLFDGIKDGAHFYFVHSYYVEPEDKGVIAATTDYGVEFTSAIVKDNIWGVQFHPEKSSDVGLQVLKNFIIQYK